eukprot:SAG11_NODE_4710_length_1796_cov_13.283441_3_plen_69_part_01
MFLSSMFVTPHLTYQDGSRGRGACSCSSASSGDCGGSTPIPTLVNAFQHLHFCWYFLFYVFDTKFTMAS